MQVSDNTEICMILGIGTDLLNMAEIPDSSLSQGDPFYEKMYTPGEKLQASEEGRGKDFLRRRFAAKEAVFKALGADPDRVRMGEIEILDDPFGAPYVTLFGEALAYAKERGIGGVLVSVSSGKGSALAFALAQDESCSSERKEISE